MGLATSAGLYGLRLCVAIHDMGCAVKRMLLIYLSSNCMDSIDNLHTANRVICFNDSVHEVNS